MNNIGFKKNNSVRITVRNLEGSVYLSSHPLDEDITLSNPTKDGGIKFLSVYDFENEDSTDPWWEGVIPADSSADILINHIDKTVVHDDRILVNTIDKSSSGYNYYIIIAVILIIALIAFLYYKKKISI